MYYSDEAEKSLQSCKDDIAYSWDATVDVIREEIDKAYQEGYTTGFNEGISTKETN